MTVRFLADEDIKPAVIQGLRSREPAIDILDVPESRRLAYSSFPTTRMPLVGLSPGLSSYGPPHKRKNGATGSSSYASAECPPRLDPFDPQPPWPFPSAPAAGRGELHPVLLPIARNARE